MVESLLRIASDEGLHKGGLADARRTDDGDDGESLHDDTDAQPVVERDAVASAELRGRDDE